MLRPVSRVRPVSTALGYRIVVDVDLSQFFDRINHDILIDRLRKRIHDPGIIRLVQRAGDGTAQAPLRQAALEDQRIKECSGKRVWPQRWWHNSALALNNVLTIAYFDSLGMPRLS